MEWVIFERVSRCQDGQLWLAVASILLMTPVLLDAIHVISLGQWRIAPFIILLIASLAISGRKSDRTKP